MKGWPVDPLTNEPAFLTSVISSEGITLTCSKNFVMRNAKATGPIGVVDTKFNLKLPWVRAFLHNPHHFCLVLSLLRFTRP
jgi:hypothetical protein